MKKIVDEIIENTPELEKNKDSLGKTVNFLNENNPKILPTKEFRDSLKNRLKSLIALKQNKKPRFAIFAIPVFSAMFVVAGFFYYFDDINFINNPSSTKIKSINKVSEQELHMKEINEIGEMFEEELQKVINEEKEYQVEAKSIYNDVPKNKKGEAEANSSIMLMRIPNDTTFDEVDNQEKVKNIDESNVDLKTSEEDYQIMEIFEALEEEYPDDFNADESVEFDSRASMFKGVGSNDNTEKGMWGVESDAMIESEKNMNFIDYCESELGTLSGSGKLEKCIVDKKECLASEFINGSCEFREIK